MEWTWHQTSRPFRLSFSWVQVFDERAMLCTCSALVMNALWKQERSERLQAVHHCFAVRKGTAQAWQILVTYRQCVKTPGGICGFIAERRCHGIWGALCVFQESYLCRQEWVSTRDFRVIKLDFTSAAFLLASAGAEFLCSAWLKLGHKNSCSPGFDDFPVLHTRDVLSWCKDQAVLCIFVVQTALLNAGFQHLDVGICSNWKDRVRKPNGDKAGRCELLAESPRHEVVWFADPMVLGFPSEHLEVCGSAACMPPQGALSFMYCAFPEMHSTKGSDFSQVRCVAGQLGGEACNMARQ